MRNLTSWMLPLFASSLALSGCSATVSPNVTDGSGFSELTPLPATKAYIVNNDLRFAKQLLAHNATCQKQPGCRKASQ